MKQEKVVFPFNSLPPISHNEAKLLSRKNHEKDLVSEETEVLETEVLVSKETKVPFLWWRGARKFGNKQVDTGQIATVRR